MKMQKRQFRIGQLAKKLNLERFVVRFWEKEFNIKTNRSSGKQRFYSQDDLAQFTYIKELLYEKGFTIAGAKKQLNQINTKNNLPTIIASKKTDFNEDAMIPTKKIDADLSNKHKKLFLKIVELRKQLVKLKNEFEI